MSTTKSEHKRRECDKQRLLATELLSGLQGSHPYQQVYNVANEAEEGETVNGTFRILGGHRVRE